MSYIKATTKKRSMTMDDASTLEHIIREAKMRSSPEFYTEDSNVAGLNASPPGLNESANNSNFIEHPSGAFELFFVSGVHPNTQIDNPGHWQADIIFQYPSNDSHAFRSSALDSSNLSDFAFPEGVESFHVDNDDASIEQINLLQDRHYFTLTDANEVYHGFCLSVAHPVLYGNKSEKQFVLLDKDNIVSDGYDEEVDETVENAGDDSYVNSHHKDRSANILEETGELLDALGEVEPEKPTPFEKPDLASFSQEKLPDQPKRIKYVIPENIPANKNVKVIIGETQCIFTIPENAIPGQNIDDRITIKPCYG